MNGRGADALDRLTENGMREDGTTETGSLRSLALGARDAAYAPYSGFRSIARSKSARAVWSSPRFSLTSPRM